MDRPDVLLRAIEAAAAEHRQNQLDSCCFFLKKTESPIEAAMYVALAQACRSLNNIVSFEPQVQIGAYRADFVLTSDAQRLVVECDGHDFHERTKRQAARDRARDRSMLEAGYQVMRFTGSEIYADAMACARQAVEHVEKLAHAVRCGE
ncbi:endonuclease domain-containing protein [Sphingobium xenophagum]|uniref:endonuclease domain-containing protein n=1 Tax=Sphingobium xenophagum TaxID=121428 RepID=UPI000370D422|nr:DUF559 domain-containing protein [Sphingobium xenophagum]